MKTRKELEMNKESYDRMLIKWVKGHYWDSLEKDKDLILLHLRTFVVIEAMSKKENPEELGDGWRKRRND